MILLTTKRRPLGLFNSPAQAVLSVLALLGFLCVDVIFFRNGDTESEPKAPAASPSNEPKKSAP